MPLPIDTIAHTAAEGLSAIYAIASAFNLIGTAPVRRAYRLWHYPGKFHRVVGVLQLFTAVFLWVPETRIWGIVLAGILGFFAVVTLLNHRQYAWSVPAMLLLAALVPVALAQS